MTFLHSTKYYLQIVQTNNQNHSSSLRNSRISPGWQSRISQMVSSVENLTALAFPVFKTERFAGVIPTLSANSCDEILRFAIITSRFTIIGIRHQIVKSCSSFITLTIRSISLIMSNPAAKISHERGVKNRS